MDKPTISSKELLSQNAIPLPKYAKDFSHYSFWQYTRLESADLILASKSFRISNLNGMNDLDEAKQHETDRHRVFALCFCNSDTEKIPMWYLYSGIAGKGAAIGFTPAKMLKWIQSITEVRGVKAGQKKNEGDILTVGKDVQFEYGWVYYQKPQEPKNIYYRNEWYRIDDVATFQNGNYFIKYYPWEYEREYRLVFHTKQSYDAIFVDIPEKINDSVKVKLAPELTQQQFNKVKNLACIGPTHTPAYSDLKIRMNLFSRNRPAIIEYLTDELSSANSEIEADKICNAIQSAGRCPKQ